MSYLPEFFTVAFIHLFAVMVPGPDFVLTSRNAFVYSRRTGIYSSIGLGLGIMTHAAYSLVGIGLLISRSIVLFTIVKWLGAGYLLYIGYKSLRAKKSLDVSKTQHEYKKDISAAAAVRMGYLTNILNPKATLFFLSLFTQVIDSGTPPFVQVLYGLEMGLMTWAWFSFVTIVLSHHRVQRHFSAVQHRVEQVMGAALMALGIKVALSTQK